MPVSGSANTVAPPNAQRRTTVAVTAARITGRKPAMVYSIRITSMAKTTPASGVLKDAPIAAAQPQANSVRVLLSGSANRRPSQVEAAAPRCTAGPSRPPERPAVKATTVPTNCRDAARQGSRPLCRASLSITWVMPRRSDSAGRRFQARPSNRAPATGIRNRNSIERLPKLSESSPRSSQAAPSMAP